MGKIDMVQFFDEMNLLSSEKAERLKTARYIKKKMDDFFAAQFADLKRGIYLSLKTSDEYRELLVDLYLSFLDFPPDAYMESRADRWASEVQDTTDNAVVNSDIYQRLSIAILTGSEIMSSDIPDNVLNQFSEDRSTRIALHESNVIHNYARHRRLAETQYTHTWDTMKDDKVRPHHAEADGQTVPITEPFIVMGERLMFPGDDSMGASAANLILCRCIEL